MRTARRTLLVPLDGSALADRVLVHVEALASSAPWEVLLLRVLEPVLPAALSQEAAADLARGEREAAGAHLAQVQRRLERAGARVTTQLAEGDPAAEILFAIADRRPGLVAMSTHGRGGLERLVRGSVAERVLRACTAPLLLVPPGKEPPRARVERILVPLDGTDRAQAILPLVQELACRHGAEVLLLHVDPIGSPPGCASEQLRRACDWLAAVGVTARALELGGGIASRILDVAEREQVDLIAMTTHGRTGAPRLLEGSVCEEVLRHGRRAVLAVHVA